MAINSINFINRLNKTWIIPEKMIDSLGKFILVNIDLFWVTNFKGAFIESTKSCQNTVLVKTKTTYGILLDERFVSDELFRIIKIKLVRIGGSIAQK